MTWLIECCLNSKIMQILMGGQFFEKYQKVEKSHNKIVKFEVVLFSMYGWVDGWVDVHGEEAMQSKKSTYWLNHGHLIWQCVDMNIVNINLK